MVLMRLFQTSRRFDVQIQPQLVLLQKTLLNIEGLGRELDPELDLWSTAKPFLEKWMLEQIGPKKLLEQLKAEAPRYAKLIPELPRLVHEYLKARAQPQLNDEVLKLLKETRQTQSTMLRVMWMSVGFVIGMLAMQWLFQLT